MNLLPSLMIWKNVDVKIDKDDQALLHCVEKLNNELRPTSKSYGHALRSFAKGSQQPKSFNKERSKSKLNYKD